MFKSKIAAVIIAVAATALALTACNPASTVGPVSTYTPVAASVSDAPTFVPVPPAPVTAAPAADPYSSDGDWLVPTEIVPGQYKAVSTGSIEGYVEVCATMDCAIGAGMIKNYLVDGPTYITVPANAVKVHLDRVALTSMG